MNTENSSSNPQQPHIPGSPEIPDEDEFNLIDLLLVLLKHKKMIFITCAVSFIGMCIISLFMTKIYISTARILPPQENKSSLSSALGGMSDLASLAGVSMGGSTGELYVSMLKSRTISDAIIDHFNLMELYGANNRVSAYNRLKGQVKISYGDDDGIIEIKVENTDPKLAADMANKYVNELEKMNVRLNLGTAGRERVFLEKRLETIKADLIKAEDNLKSFQETNKAIRIDDQATAIIDAISSLKAELANREVQLGVLLSYQTEQNPQVKELREAITQLNAQLEKLEDNPVEKQVSTDIFITTSEVPELGIQYARLLREFKIQETLFELLTQQYEIAKITEARDTSTVQILDEAVTPDRKSKPKKSIIVIVTTLIFGMLSVFAAFVIEFSSRLKEEDPDLWHSLQTQFSFIKNWAGIIRSKVHRK